MCELISYTTTGSGGRGMCGIERRWESCWRDLKVPLRLRVDRLR